MSKGKCTHKPIKAILGGIGISVIISILFAALLGTAFVNDVLNENRTKLGVSVVQIISVVLGGVIAGKRCGEKYILLTTAVGCTYYFIVTFATLFIWRTGFNGLGIGALMCAVGVLGATLLCLFKPRKSKHRKRKL